MRLCLTLLLTLIACQSTGQTELDDVLGGFDDLPTPSGSSDLDDALLGFDDPPASSSIGTVDDVLLEFEDPPSHFVASEIDNVLEGFDAVSTPEPVKDSSDPKLAWLRFGGTLSQGVTVNFAHDAPIAGGLDHRGLSSLRSRLNFEIDADLGPEWNAGLSAYAWYDLVYQLNAAQGYPTVFLETYEREFELGEFFVQGPISENMDLTFGRQVVVWGRSDQFRVTDVLNPVDNRIPGMTDIEDLRLPLAMARIDLYVYPWHANFVVIPERRFDKTPVLGSDFFVGSIEPPLRDFPQSSFGQPELAASLNATLPGWDISLYAANIFDDRPHIEITESGPRRRHNRVRMTGVAGNVVLGNWLLKGEAALVNGLRYSNLPNQDFSRISVLAGAEYSGFADTAIALEATNTRILDFDDHLSSPPDDRRQNEPAAALRFSRRFFHDTLDISLGVIAFGRGGKSGVIQRAQATYEWTDELELTGGVVLYEGGSQSPFRGIGDNDRLFLSMDYHF